MSTVIKKYFKNVKTLHIVTSDYHILVSLNKSKNPQSLQYDHLIALTDQSRGRFRQLRQCARGSSAGAGSSQAVSAHVLVPQGRALPVSPLQLSSTQGPPGPQSQPDP